MTSVQVTRSAKRFPRFALPKATSHPHEAHDLLHAPHRTTRTSIQPKTMANREANDTLCKKLQSQIHQDLRLETLIHKASEVLAKLLLQRFPRCLSFPASLAAAHETILENLAKFPWRFGQCKSPLMPKLNWILNLGQGMGWGSQTIRHHLSSVWQAAAKCLAVSPAAF